MSALKDELLAGVRDANAPLTTGKVSPQLLAITRQILADVEAGKITSIAFITVSALGQIQWPGFGMQVADMYVGAGLFQRSIEAALTGQGQGGRLLRG